MKSTKEKHPRRGRALRIVLVSLALLIVLYAAFCLRNIWKIRDPAESSSGSGKTEGKAAGSVVSDTIPETAAGTAGPDIPAPSEGTAVNGDGKFRIRYELGDAADVFTDRPPEAGAGETVEIRTCVICDADIHVYVNGQEINKSHYDSDYWGYTFVMPESEVLVTAKFYTKEEVWGLVPLNQAALKKKYPEYFDLPTGKGLELYVWQMGPNSYSFGLLPGTNRIKTTDEIWQLKGASAEEMRGILSSYDMTRSEVLIIPWQNPISSYLADYFIVGVNEDSESVAARRQAYVDKIREMLFASPDAAP
ncbi:MAG: hypothetical protein J5496_06950 [Lachnospiraceae bacterium]|nr:hypothetical protein [Lachnospiraceae bacterium]